MTLRKPSRSQLVKQAGGGYESTCRRATAECRHPSECMDTICVEPSWCYPSSPSRVVSFRVFGDPVPQGSKRAFAVRRKDGSVGAAVVESSGAKLKTWRGRVAAAVQEHRPDDGPWDGPVLLELTFLLRRPLRPKHAVPSGRPDLDKLYRATADELSGVVFVDDAQIVRAEVTKSYADEDYAPGAFVTVRRVATRVTRVTHGGDDEEA